MIPGEINECSIDAFQYLSYIFTVCGNNGLSHNSNILQTRDCNKPLMISCRIHDCVRSYIKYYQYQKLQLLSYVLLFYVTPWIAPRFALSQSSKHSDSALSGFFLMFWYCSPLPCNTSDCSTLRALSILKTFGFRPIGLLPHVLAGIKDKPFHASMNGLSFIPWYYIFFKNALYPLYAS